MCRIDRLMGELLAPMTQELAELRTELARLQAERGQYLEALGNLYALVNGESPALLDSDSGGDARLALEIEVLLGNDYANITKDI